VPCKCGRALKIGDRVEHIDGGWGTVEAFWVVFDDKEAIPCDDSVIKAVVRFDRTERKSE
jgi:hypothetical protein